MQVGSSRFESGTCRILGIYYFPICSFTWPLLTEIQHLSLNSLLWKRRCFPVSGCYRQSLHATCQFFRQCIRICASARQLWTHKTTRVIYSDDKMGLHAVHYLWVTFKPWTHRRSSEVIIIIIPMTMFIVLSSWPQGHCESSLGSFDECRTAP